MECGCRVEWGWAGEAGSGQSLVMSQKIKGVTVSFKLQS